MKKKPDVIAALICEKVLEEKDGVYSAVRIIDRSKIMVHDESTFPDLKVSYSMILILKPGECLGEKGFLQIQEIHPSGKKDKGFRLEIEFENEPDRGISLVGSIDLQGPLPGVYWYEVRFADELLTRIPLRIIHSRPPEPIQSSQ